MAALYPGNDDGSFSPCDKYDPRNRMWLMQLTQKGSMFYHFYIDYSHSMTKAYRPGGLSAKTIVNFFVRKFVEQMIQVTGVTIHLHQLENPSNEAVFKAFDVEVNRIEKLDSFLTYAKDFGGIRTSTMITNVLRSVSNQDDTRNIIMTDMKIDNLNGNTFVLNFGETENANRLFNMADEFAEGESLWEVYYKVKHEIVSYLEESELKITSPYVDFMGAGEIVTIGYPIMNTAGKVIGAAAIDTPILTHGVRNGPYQDSVFFDGRFDSFLIIVNLNQDIVLSHPLKASHGFTANSVNVKGNHINDTFRTTEERTMMIDLRNWNPTDTANPFKKVIADFHYPVGNIANISYYWLVSDHINGKDTQEKIAFGIGILDEEKQSLAHKISETIKKENDEIIRISLSNNDTEPINLQTIADLYEYEKLRRFDNKLAADSDFVHFTPESVRNPIFGSDFKSAQFQFYNKRFKECWNSYLGETCRDLFTPRAFEESRELQYARDFGQWMFEDNETPNDVKEKVRSIYIASLGGLYKTFGRLPPYGYNPSFRRWFEQGIQRDGLQFIVNRDYGDGPTILTMTKRITRGTERKYVVAVDIEYDLFLRLAKETCSKAKNKETEFEDKSNIICAIYTQDLHLIYNEEFDKDELGLEFHTAATTNRQVIELEIKRGSVSPVQCKNRETEECEVYSFEMKNNIGTFQEDASKCLQYRLFNSADDKVNILLRNKPTGLGCSVPIISSNMCFDNSKNTTIPFCPKDQQLKKEEKNIYETCNVSVVFPFTRNN